MGNHFVKLFPAHINGNDFSTLRVMVYIFSLLFILGQILTDISYSIVDPRVRLG